MILEKYGRKSFWLRIKKWFLRCDPQSTNNKRKKNGTSSKLKPSVLQGTLSRARKHYNRWDRPAAEGHSAWLSWRTVAGRGICPDAGCSRAAAGPEGHTLGLLAGAGDTRSQMWVGVAPPVNMVRFM